MYMNEWLWVFVCVCFNKLRKKVTDIKEIKHSSFRRGIPKTEYGILPVYHVIGSSFSNKTLWYPSYLSLLLLMYAGFNIPYDLWWKLEKKIATARTYSVSVCLYVCMWMCVRVSAMQLKTQSIGIYFIT